jgi:two-component system invasion response regulator UvrY
VIRVFLADDHPVIVSGLERLFASIEDIEVVGTAHDLRHLEALTLPDVDVLVLDVSMPGMHGRETIALLTQRFAPVLLFTLEPESAQVVALLRGGAAGVVSKSAPVDVLLAAIRTVAAGARVVAPELEARASSAGEGWPHEALSEREHAIFVRLIRGVSPKTMAFDLGLSPSTVYTYAERVRLKLGVSSQVELVDYAHRAGLLGKGSHEG